MWGLALGNVIAEIESRVISRAAEEWDNSMARRSTNGTQIYISV
jgi:hypothetical protein